MTGHEQLGRRQAVNRIDLEGRCAAVLEAQSGDYPGANDIERFDDAHGRS